MAALSNEYVWHSDWFVDAPVDQVWKALSRPEDWPRWWPFLASVRDLAPGDGRGVGALRHFEWRTRLPYRVRLDMETLEVAPGHLLSARAGGDAEGLGTWRLLGLGKHTRVAYEWRIRLDRPWMRRLAPLLAPLFKWNHDAVMAAGQAGLRRFLAGERP